MNSTFVCTFKNINFTSFNKKKSSIFYLRFSILLLSYPNEMLVRYVCVRHSSTTRKLIHGTSSMTAWV